MEDDINYIFLLFTKLTFVWYKRRGYSSEDLGSVTLLCYFCQVYSYPER